MRKTNKPNQPANESFIQALNFFAEAGLLKKIKRSGWWVAGIKDPETVAEHSFRTAVIGFYLAHMEGVDPFRTVSMALFNDIHESRINDLHKMGHYYIDFKDAEKKVFKDQVRDLDKRVKSILESLRDEYDGQDSPESIVARDADILECLIQAKEYYDSGNLGAGYFFARAPDHLKSNSAKMIWEQISLPGNKSDANDKNKWNSHDWWQDVIKFER